MDLTKQYIYKNEQTDNVSLHESCIKRIDFNCIETIFHVDWSQGYGDFLIKCSYPESVEYNFTTINEYLSQNTVLNYLEITDFSYLKDKNGYTIQIDFDNYPVGYIRMHCLEFSFECPSLPICIGGNGHRIPWDPIKTEDSLDS